MTRVGALRINRVGALRMTPCWGAQDDPALCLWFHKAWACSIHGMKRLLSVDVLRGLTIAFMILVNDPGDGHVSYAALEHADWNGFTPTDLVFPTFLLLVGLSMVLSYARREARGASAREYLRHALLRAVLLFAIGVVLNGFPLFPWHTLRIYGVLQRIAVCFAVGAYCLS